ncbi:predicted protein [Nematostella vectensis]|uniref:Core-binding (CB) domain-containing protein n=1 Tax=Nematostella vectensis TaxID=45351 RepID=A7SIQ6_NEMVE|nr:predicted protein [Nematostella vectensis]|eukprot:XP_001628445.1 predicted protein [Nematostella vectensis]
MSKVGKENIKIENLRPVELNHLLSKFFMEVMKANGENYEPDTISSYQRSIQRFLDEAKYPWNILKDKEFVESRDVLAARRKALRKRRVQGIMLGRHRALNQNRNHRLRERGTQTRTGKEQGHRISFQPKALATGTRRCPVAIYKKFRAHRPPSMTSPDAPFLAVNHRRSPGDEIWYKQAPLGKNEIGKFLSLAAKKASIQLCRCRNHSVRKTRISRLLDAGVPENFVAQLSGQNQPRA